MPNPDRPISPDPYIADDDAGGSGGWIPDGSTTPAVNPGSYTTKTCKLVIKYYANGSSAEPPSESIATYSGEKQAVTLSRMVKGPSSDFVRSGYAFIGWSTTSNGSVEYDPGQIIRKEWAANESGTVTYRLYAVWTSNGRIVYKPGQYANEATNAWHDKYSDKPINQPVQLRGAIFTRTGYNLVGWQLGDQTHVGLINESVTFTSSDEVILYPEWEAKVYTLTFKSNGVTNESDVTIQATYDAEITMPNSLTFAKEGYHIFLWNENAEGTATAWFPGKTYIFTRTSNITFYAFWEGNEYYVIYHDTEGEIPDPIARNIIDYSYFLLDDNNVVTANDPSIADLELDNNNILYATGSRSIPQPGESGSYAVAIYGKPFYTEYRPPVKDNYTFMGWKTADGQKLVKNNYCLDSYSFGENPTWTLLYNVDLYPIWSGNYPYGKMFFGRKESSDYGILIEQPPDYYWPEREFTFNSIKGKTGDIPMDSNRYKNIEKKYKIAVCDKDGFGTAAKNLSEFLHRYDGYPDYLRLEDSYEPDVYMLGLYIESNNAENILNQAGRAEITFNCKPKKYLLSGNRKIEILESSTVIHNPTDHPALPLITIWGTGTVTFKGRPANSAYTNYQVAPEKETELEILHNFNQITLDAETFECYDVNNKNANPYVAISERVALYSGDNTITYDGDIEKIVIIPRWWRL